MKEIRRVQVANGPGMVMFSPDGRNAFICSSFTSELDIVDTRTFQVVKRLVQASAFSPNIAVSPDGEEFWICLKDAGKTQAFSAKAPFNQIAVLETGPITNHVNFVENKNGKFAYITIGGLNQVKVYRRGSIPNIVGGNAPNLVATIPVGELPHGIWPSGDGSRVYVALENGGTVQAIDTLSNKVIATIPIGQTAQALVYVPNAVPAGEGSENLQPLGDQRKTVKIEMVAPAKAALPDARASVGVDSQGILDLLEIAASGLRPNSQYQLYLVQFPRAPFGKMLALAKLTTLSDGAAVAQAIGPLKQVVPEQKEAGGAELPRRFLLVTSLESPNVPVLVEEQAH